MTNERWLKVRSVSRRIDVHFRTVYRWIDEGKFKADEVRQLETGQWRIAESAVERIVNTQIHGSS